MPAAQGPEQCLLIEPRMTDRRPIQQQHRNLQSVAAPPECIAVHVGRQDRRQRALPRDPGKRRAHLLTELALLTYQQQQARRGPRRARRAAQCRNAPPEGRGALAAPANVSRPRIPRERSSGSLALGPAWEASLLLAGTLTGIVRPDPSAAAGGSAARINCAICRTVCGGTSPTTVMR